MKDPRKKLYQDLVNQIIEEFDLDTYTTPEWLKSKTGQEHFIKWLQSQGYKVNAYVWPSEKEPKSQGLEFNDNDPLFIALKLKHFGND